MLKDELHSVPFSLSLMESTPANNIRKRVWQYIEKEKEKESETCIFCSLRTAIFQNVQSLQYIRKDVMVISVSYECPT